MLNHDSLIWAIRFIEKFSDGDLFPRILEFDAISEKEEDMATELCAADLSQLNIGAHRRFIVPKDEMSYRQATQLSPLDSIILSAIIHQYGSGIETRRLPPNIVFSYRFAPSLDYGLYHDDGMWREFWCAALARCASKKYVLYCDIADYYNQVYHHTLENQLIKSEFPNRVIKWIMKLVESTTAGVSRGVPIGPHAAHMLAEAALIPIDNSLSSQGIDFIRYVDDIVVFCDSQEEAQINLFTIATTLDKQQRLILQRHKTKILTADEFRTQYMPMTQDRPISDEESAILEVIGKYTSDNPYIQVPNTEISNDDWNSITADDISKVVMNYLEIPTEFDRLRWFYRRLTQIGHPGGIDVTLANIDKLTPCIANVCTYLGSVQRIDEEKWKEIGELVLSLFSNKIIQSNEYFRLLLLSLYSKNQSINHFASLVQNYQRCEPFARREVILAAKPNRAIDWLREQKESYSIMDPWQQMAFIYSISDLPRDEKQYFINNQGMSDQFMKVLAKWSRNQ